MATAEALPSKTKIARALERRFFLRVHMFVLLASTFLVGLTTTNILLDAHVRSMAFRYGFAVCVSFAAFVGMIRLWLAYVGHCAERERSKGGPSSSGDWFQFVDFSGGGCNSSSSLNLAGEGNFTSEGGRFGGGGATGSWSETSALNVAAASPPAPAGAGKGFSLGGFSLDVDDDFVLVLLVVAVALAVGLAAFYLIWVAPAVLTEVAFNAALAGALARKTKKMSSGEWIGSVFRTTCIPFLVVLLVATSLGWYAQKRCPGATRMSEAIHCARR